MHGRSSWTSENACTSSNAAAAGSAASGSLPAASAVARQMTARAAAGRARAIRSRQSGGGLLLSLEVPENPVHERRRVLRRVPLGQNDSLVDRHLVRHRSLLELVDAYPQNVALERTEPVGGPGVRRRRDPLVEMLRLLGDRAGEPGGELVRLALVERPKRLTGDVPLVEQEPRRPARLAPADGRHTGATDGRRSSISAR